MRNELRETVCLVVWKSTRLILFLVTLSQVFGLHTICLADEQELVGGSELNASLRLNEPSDEPVIRGSALSISNSDHITHRENSIGFRKDVHHSRLHTYGADYFDINGAAVWLHYTGTKVIAFTEYAFADGLVLTASGGAGTLTLRDFFSVAYGQSKTLPLGRLKLEESPIPLTFFRVEASDDFSYMAWTDAEHLPVIMPASSLFAEAEHFTQTKLQLRTNVREVYFGDSNQQFIFDNLALQQLIENPLTLKLGAGGGWTTFANQTGSYWSPDYLANYGLRAVVAYDFDRNWHTEGRFNYGLHQDRSGRTGKESAAELHFEYHANSGNAVRLVANLLDSENGVWWRDDLNLVAEIPF